MRAVTSSRMAGKARVLAVLLLLVFARLATAVSSSHNGDNLPPMNPPIILNEDPNTPITYEWPYEGAWPLSDDDDALANAYAADEAAYVLADYAEGVVPEAQGETGLHAKSCRQTVVHLTPNAKAMFNMPVPEHKDYLFPVSLGCAPRLPLGYVNRA